MTGNVVLTDGSRWACSNMAELIDHIDRTENNTITKTKDLKINNIFGSLNMDAKVEVLFKPDMAGSDIIGINGRVRYINGKTVYITYLGALNNTQEIYTKIKKLGGN